MTPEDSMRNILLGTALLVSTGVALAQTAPKFVNPDKADAMSSNLIDLDVYNGDGKDVGKIKDIVLKDSSIAGYVVSVGGFLGMGSKYVVVAPESVKIKFDTQDHKWHANMSTTADQLKAAPEYKYTGKADAKKS